MAKNKSQQYLLVIFAVVVLAAVVWWIQKPGPQSAPSTKDTVQTGSQNQNKQVTKSPQSGTTIDGVLKKSDNAKKGNLMLVTSSRTVYIFTSRDYSELLDKSVTMSYEGTLDEFRLGDIVAK